MVIEYNQLAQRWYAHTDTHTVAVALFASTLKHTYPEAEIVK